MSEDKKVTDGDTKNIKIEPETITIEKSKLDKLIKRVERVEASANKASLARWDSSHKEATKKIVKLSKYNGKVVKSWSDMIKNKVEKNPKTGVWEEDQIIRLEFFEGKPEEVAYAVLTRGYDKFEAEVHKETRNMDKEAIEAAGAYTYDVEGVEDGKKYIIGSKFVN